MTTAPNIRPVAPPLPDIVGYVEALTANRLLGWAWAPAQPDSRVMIELHHGDDLVTSAIADLQRADLASNGIGDGRHAFDIEIPSKLCSRAAELRVFARVSGGEATPIGAPPAADGLSEQVVKVLRGVDMLLSSQRLIHRNLQTALTAPRNAEEASVTSTLNRLGDLQAGTDAQLAVIERFVVRLDEHLSRLSPESFNAASKARSVPSVALAALGVAAVALIVSLVGVVRSLGY